MDTLIFMKYRILLEYLLKVLDAAVQDIGFIKRDPWKMICKVRQVGEGSRTPWKNFPCFVLTRTFHQCCS